MATFNDVPQNVEFIETNYQEISHVLTVAKRGKALGKVWGPTGVAIDPTTNRIYVAECVNIRVSIFSESGRFLSTFTHEYLMNPWGIAVHSNNVYITDIIRHFVLHFKMAEDIRVVGKRGGRGSGIGQFDYPRGLTVSTTGDIFVTDQNNHRIQILDSKLHFLRHISHDSMRRPSDVILTPDEVYVLSNTDSPCVHVFSHTGDKIRSLITGEYAGDQLAYPALFCLDANKNFVISYIRPSVVKVFSQRGTLLTTLGCSNNQPHGIALVDNRKLVVVSHNCDNGIQMFY